jgi:hypothetical protein
MGIVGNALRSFRLPPQDGASTAARISLYQKHSAAHALQNRHGQFRCLLQQIGGERWESNPLATLIEKLRSLERVYRGAEVSAQTKEYQRLQTMRRLPQVQELIFGSVCAA